MMRVVHYLFGMPPLRKGGLPQYALSLIERQKMMGHHVEILVPGPFTKAGETKIKKWKVFHDVPSYRILNAMPVSNEAGINNISAFTKSVSGTCFEEWLGNQNIDIMHVHSLMGLPVELLYAAKKAGIKIVMTTHDFFGICPKIDLMQGENVCEDADWISCSTCCKNAYAVRQLRFYHSDLYWWYCNQQLIFRLTHSKMGDGLKAFLRSMRHAGRKLSRNPSSEKLLSENPSGESDDNGEKIDYRSLRDYYQNMFGCVDYFLFNSSQTAKVYRQFLKCINGEVIHVSNRDMKDCRVKKEFGDVLQLGYVGNKSTYKGYPFLMDTLQRLYEAGKTKFVCHTFLIENDIEYPFVVNHGQYKYGEQESVYKKIDVLIVPSRWKETFGFVVAEAISNGVPVLVSENVGAKEIIEENPGIGKVFSVAGDELFTILNSIYEDRSILMRMNQKILEMKYAFGMDEHAHKIETVYKKLLSS